MKRLEMRTVSGALPGGVALGTMPFGTGIEEEKAFSLLEAHTRRPGAQIDTARSYASWLPGGAGKSERTIGKWLKTAGRECREQLFLGTKGCLMPRGYNPSRGDLSPERIRRELEESLEGLPDPGGRCLCGSPGTAAHIRQSDPVWLWHMYAGAVGR